MKKLASILGIGMISMAVAFAPAFAQQTPTPATTGSGSIQPKSDETSAPSKAGSDVTNEGIPGKTPSDVKAGSSPTGADVHKDMKGAGSKPGASLKSHKSSKSASANVKSKHHVKKSSGKVASRAHAKTRTSNLDNRRKAGKSENQAPVTGK